MRVLFISWAAAWPTITALLLLLDGVIGHWPLALRTLVLTGVMVPLMARILVPALNLAIERLSAQGAGSVIAPAALEARAHLRCNRADTGEDVLTHAPPPRSQSAHKDETHRRFGSRPEY